LNFDALIGSKLSGLEGFMKENGIDLEECYDDPMSLDTPRKIFERRIRYWDKRPMPDDPGIIVSPADSRMLPGSFDEADALFIKEKFFDLVELLGSWNREWISAFAGGDYAVFRLTPDKYHYNHCPVSGEVVDFYAMEGRYAPCNPAAVIRLAGPYSKNYRVVTIIDTDCKEGTGAGLVAMIEVAAMMVGDIVQAYSDEHYDDPREATKGMHIHRGRPKSLFRPGSSTVVLLFQKGRVSFYDDLLKNQHRDIRSRYSAGLGRTLVETEVMVRSGIAHAT
ncbi:MAG TPA: phosphatidylserine decarboxylase, partial [Desulfomonilia bacterium]|nr:phosphatidylserine decarboxylase [Desulfomonilia bacterium]